MRWHVSDWRKPEEENFRIATDLLAKGALDRAFVYAASFDALQHDAVGRDDALRPKVDYYAGKIRQLHSALTKSGRDAELTVFSDHGMTPLAATLNAPAALAQTGLVWGRDYASLVDSTMVRIWYLKDVRSRIHTAFRNFPGHWLSEDEMRYHGIWRKDAKFGEDIFLAAPGVQFSPGDMGAKPLNGMHGYDPNDEDSLAAFLSTAPVAPEITKVADYFSAMTRG